MLPSEQTVRVAATWSTDTHGAPIHMDVIPRIVGGTGILQRTGNRCRNTPVMLCNAARNLFPKELELKGRDDLQLCAGVRARTWGHWR